MRAKTEKMSTVSTYRTGLDYKVYGTLLVFFSWVSGVFHCATCDRTHWDEWGSFSQLLSLIIPCATCVQRQCFEFFSNNVIRLPKSNNQSHHRTKVVPQTRINTSNNKEPERWKYGERVEHEPRMGSGGFAQWVQCKTPGRGRQILPLQAASIRTLKHKIFTQESDYVL